eukprot:Nitzschia sp. Nitz4//scaffold22_size323478//188805//189311//NITZ4_000551-RA/size323478-processed-gene-0.472-mRNA-1//-1//CDS//3329543067//8954//frame0
MMAYSELSEVDFAPLQSSLSSDRATRLEPSLDLDDLCDISGEWANDMTSFQLSCWEDTPSNARSKMFEVADQVVAEGFSQRKSTDKRNETPDDDDETSATAFQTVPLHEIRPTSCAVTEPSQVQFSEEVHVYTIPKVPIEDYAELYYGANELQHMADEVKQSKTTIIR